MIKEVANYIESDLDGLTIRLVEQAIDHLELDLTSEQIDIHNHLLKALLSQIANNLHASREEIETINLNYDKDNYFINDNTVLKDTIEILRNFRISLMKEIQKDGLMENVCTLEMTELYEQIIFIFDNAIRSTTNIFNAHHKQQFESYEKELLELTAPIVPIKNGIAVLPIIGNITESRAHYIQNEIIPKVSQLNIEILVIDFSGIHGFDTYIARYFFQIKDILSLLGIKTIMTGFRPTLVQTIVQLGIDMDNLEVYRTLEQCLEVINQNETTMNSMNKI